MGDNQEGVTYGRSRTTVARGQRVVALPSENWHIMHARCVVNAVRRSRARIPLLCEANSSHSSPWGTGGTTSGSSGRPWAPNYGSGTRGQT